MTRTRSIPNLRACKSEAKRLLAEVRAGSREAAERIRRIPPFSDSNADDILHDGDAVQLKHAQWAVALEQGHRDWKRLKDAADFAWYPRGSAHLNAWFARYEDARDCLDRHGGYLLTHHGKFFVCEARYIESLGLDPKDSRWQAAGFDVARPRDKRAGADLTRLAETEATKSRLRVTESRQPPEWIKRR